jgi:hypothetical protein
MLTWKRITIVCCVLAAIGATGWTAYQAGLRTFKVDESGPVMNPDGSATGSSTWITSNDPNFTQEAANQLHLQTKEAIASGDYALSEVKQTDHGALYIYTVYLPGGKTISHGTQQPLPEPEDFEE